MKFILFVIYSLMVSLVINVILLAIIYIIWTNTNIDYKHIRSNILQKICLQIKNEKTLNVYCFLIFLHLSIILSKSEMNFLLGECFQIVKPISKFYYDI